MAQFSTFVDPLNGSMPPGNKTAGFVAGINDSSTVYGAYWNDVISTQSLFLYKNGGYTFLNIPFTIPNNTINTGSFVNGANSNGEVVGNYFGLVNNISVNHGFIYLNNEYLQLDHPSASLTTAFKYPAFGSIASGSSAGTIAAGVNNLGQIVGSYIDANGKSHGFLYYNYNYTTIDNPLGVGATTLNGINNYGAIVGSYLDSTGMSHGFTYNNGQYQQIDDPLANTNGTRLNSINDSGAITGAYVDASNNLQGFYYNAGSYQTIALPSGASLYGAKINNTGEIAGVYYTGDISKNTAVSHNFETQVYNKSTVSSSAAADNAYLLYQAAFDRIPDAGGFQYWASQAITKNLSAVQIADAFMASSEFASVFDANANNADFVTKLYNNVLGRQPDYGGAHYWTQQLDSGAARDTLLVGFALGTENVSNTASHMNNGYWVL